MMNDKIKISVIMPSVNVGDYIEECILSVINQTLQDIEIICVDANSTDGTLDILKKYAQKDARINVITSNKKSYGHQVNLGLSKAKGEYVSIIETDDFINENMFESLYDLSDNGKVDVIKGTFYRYDDYDKNNIVFKIDNSKKTITPLKKFTLKEEPLFIDGHPSVWAGIYKRSFLEENNIKMVEAPGGGWVDNPFFYETAISAKSIMYTHEPFYCYRVSNPNSSSNNFNDFTMPMNRILELYDILNKYDCNDKNILIKFYNRLFRYIEIIIENNNDTDENLDYETCLKISEVVKKVDEDIVMENLKFNFQKMYYKYRSPLFLARFKKPSELSDEDYDILLKENKFLHSNVAHFRAQFNDVNYKYSQLKKEQEINEKLLNIHKISFAKKRKKEKSTPKPKANISKIKNKKETPFSYETHKSEYPLSIIMPVFNGAKFLERSMNSLLNQTLNNFEIVLIDDGSTDNSLEILREYEKKYDFIKVLTQENSGPGKARNYGINEAKGEYIGFLDADDFFIDNDALEKMYNLATLNDAKMVTANIKHDLNKKDEFVPFGQFPYYTSNDVILPEEYGIPWSFYKNIFKRDFLVENNIYFPDLLRGEDPVFLAEVLTKIDEIYVAATDLYAYVYSSDTGKANDPRKLYDQLLHYRLVIDYLNIPKFYIHQEEYYKKIMFFCNRLDDNSVLDAIESIRDIFKDMPEFLRILEDHIYLKFSYIPEVNEAMPCPIVSVIMEANNTEKFVEKSINSLINQTMDDFELILINRFEDDVKFEYVKEKLKNETWVKFIDSTEEDIVSLRNEALNTAEGDYIYFCDDSYTFESKLLEDMVKTLLIHSSEVCLCNSPEGGRNKSPELNIKSIFGNKNPLNYQTDCSIILPHILSSTFELAGTLYKKSLLNRISSDTELLSDKSVLQIKSILSASKLSYMDKFLFKYIPIPDLYYKVKKHYKADNALNIFNICDDIESFLKEKSIYNDLKTYFDIYKINQISSYLDDVRFVGCYCYNDPKYRDLYANNSKVLDYSQYYGSESEYLGLDYSYAEEYFNKTKEEFNKLDYRDFKFADLRNNNLSNNDNLDKYKSVLKSENYKEYMEISNFSNVDKLRMKHEELTKKLKQLKLKENEDKNIMLEELKKELNNAKQENENLKKTNDQLRNEYWKQRNEYDYILSSKSWKYTKWLRKKQ